jgi:hypothetical protein
MKKIGILPTLAVSFLLASPLHAAITGVQESGTGLDPVSGRVAAVPFGDGVFSHTDRGHIYRPAAFDAGTGLLSTTGTSSVLPAYLVGAQYIELANDNRGIADYQLTIGVDTPSYVYLLLDNRLNGSAGNTTSPNTTPPDLAGPLSWVVNNGWTLMTSGISPSGQPDFVALDEGSSFQDGLNRQPPSATDQTGLNQFFTVFRNVTDANSIILGPQGIGGSNMYGVIVAPVPEPGSLVLLGLGVLGLAGYGWRKRVR